MAANNYFGYSTGATNFAASAATTYPTSQTPGYAVQHTAQTYAGATPRATQASYDTYQTAQAAAAAAYQYASRQQVSTTYDKTQSYYPQATQVYSAADTTHYQTGTGATKAATTQGAPTSYVYSTNSAGGASYSTYNSPASMYVQGGVGTTQQAAAAAAAIGATTAAGVAQSVSAAASSAIKGQNSNWAGFKKGGFMKNQKPKQPPKPQQLHYCDVCKISCAGPQTYREHLEGQKHKKKEAAAKAGAVPPSSRGGTSLRCELCDVTCTGSDAYAAHIRGTKHQKVVKLHTKLGKPIPSTEPVVLATPNSTTKTKPNAKNSFSGDKKILGTPKINFVGGTKLNTTTPDSINAAATTGNGEEDKNDIYDDKADIQPVGQDYIDEIRNDDGKVISFQCKLCECRFNDPNAKEMHMKGRRHRLQYKKKVNPDLVVDIKPSLRQRKLQEDRMRRQQMRDEMWKRQEEERWRDEMRYGREPHMMLPMMPPGRFMGPPRGPPGPNMGPPMPPRRPDSVDDRHIMAKHTSVYPKEEELGAVQKIVTNTEKALKQVSDFLAEGDAPLVEEKKEAVIPAAKKEAEVKTEVKEPIIGEKPEAVNYSEDKVNKDDKEDTNAMPNRTLKGVMRVGVLAKGLLLTGDNNVQLVVMCAEKPTRTLLDRVADNLPKQFARVLRPRKAPKETEQPSPPRRKIKRRIAQDIAVPNLKNAKACLETIPQKPETKGIRRSKKYKESSATKRSKCIQDLVTLPSISIRVRRFTNTFRIASVQHVLMKRFKASKSPSIMNDDIKKIQTQKQALKRKINQIKKVEKLNDKLKNETLDVFGGTSDPKISKNNILQLLQKQEVKLCKMKKSKLNLWHPVIIKWAVNYHSQFPSAYDVLQTLFELPASSMLYNYSSEFPSQIGFSEMTLNKMKTKIDLDQLEEHQKYFGLIIDEMKLNAVDGESEDRSTDEGRIFVMMVEGLTTNYKHVFAYFPSQHMNADERYGYLQEGIEILENNGFKILTVICDNSACNKKLIRLCTHSDPTRGVNNFKSKNTFAPKNEQRDIYYICDPTVLIKTARNGLTNSGAIKYHFQYQKGGKFITWAHIRDMYKRDKKSNPRMCPKLTPMHIKVGSLYSQRVLLAVQVMSNSVAIAIESIIGEEGYETAKFISKFNRFFDMLNSRNNSLGRIAVNNDLHPYTSTDNSRFRWLEEEFLGYLYEWRSENEALDLPPKEKRRMIMTKETLEPIVVTVHSAIETVKFLLNKGAPYVCTNRFTRDALENQYGKYTKCDSYQ